MKAVANRQPGNDLIKGVISVYDSHILLLDVQLLLS